MIRFFIELFRIIVHFVSVNRLCVDVDAIGHKCEHICWNQLIYEDRVLLYCLNRPIGLATWKYKTSDLQQLISDSN